VFLVAPEMEKKFIMICDSSAMRFLKNLILPILENNFRVKTLFSTLWLLEKNLLPPCLRNFLKLRKKNHKNIGVKKKIKLL